MTFTLTRTPEGILAATCRACGQLVGRSRKERAVQLAQRSHYSNCRAPRYTTIKESA